VEQLTVVLPLPVDYLRLTVAVMEYATLHPNDLYSYAQNAGTLGNIAASGFAQLALVPKPSLGANTFGGFY